MALLPARAAAGQALNKTATPGKSTCADVAELLGLPLAQTVKSLVLATDELNEAGDIVKAAQGQRRGRRRHHHAAGAHPHVDHLAQRRQELRQSGLAHPAGEIHDITAHHQQRVSLPFNRGIDQGLTLPAAYAGNAYEAADVPRIPWNLVQAIDLFESSAVANTDKE